MWFNFAPTFLLEDLMLAPKDTCIILVKQFRHPHDRTKEVVYGLLFRLLQRIEVFLFKKYKPGNVKPTHLTF